MAKLLFCRPLGSNPDPGPEPEPDPEWPEPTHFVTTSGNSTNSSGTFAAATNPGAPCSLGVALTYASAGDVVSVAAGTYTRTGSANRFVPAYNPTNQGTSGNPITFIADGTVVLETTTSTGPTIGAGGKDYIHWLGHFYVDEANALSTSDTGACVFVDAYHCVIDGAELIGRGNISRGDNYPGIRLEEASDITIRRCKVSNYKGEGATNSPAIQLYRSGDVLIERCELFDSDGGVTLKGTAETEWRDTVTIRQNHIHDIAQGAIEVHRTGPVPAVLVAQNLIVDCGDGGTIKQWNSPSGDMSSFGFLTGPHNLKYINNTVINTSAGGVKLKNDGPEEADQGHEFRNNIFAGSGPGVGNEDATESTWNDTDDFLWDRNCYNKSGWSFSSWRSAHSGQDVNSISADPLFVNASGGDYRLSGGSPCASLGRARFGVGGADDTVIPAGCYITGEEVIGPA